jgi:hypothetical protein
MSKGQAMNRQKNISRVVRDRRATSAARAAKTKIFTAKSQSKGHA